MDDIELTLLYLSMMVFQDSGKPNWNASYAAYERYTNSLSDQDREKYLGRVYDFHQKYKNKG